MNAWIWDLRLAIRNLRRYPGYALNAIVTIALGIASVTAVYALIHAVLLQPLPLPGGERIVAVHQRGAADAGLSLPDVIWLRERLGQIEAIATVMPGFSMDRTDSELPTRVYATLTESDYFRIVPLAPLMGRLLRAEDDRVGAPAVVVVGERYWRHALGADPHIVGQVLTLSGVSAQIVGVVSDHADLTEIGIDLYAPIPPFAPYAPTSPGSNNFQAIAQVAVDQPIAAARAEMATISAQLATLRDNPGKLMDLTPWLDYLTAGTRQGLWLLLGAVSLLLVLATANVAALVLVRTTRRQSELALRHALGASRGAMLRQLLAEGCVLGSIGGIAGVALAWAGFAQLRAQAAWALPRIAEAQIDVGVLIVAILVTGASIVVSSALPAWRVRTQQSTARSNGIGRQRSETRTLAALVTLEVMLASALLGAAMLLAQSFAALTALPLGFQPEGVVTGEVVLPDARYSGREEQTRAFTQMVDALAMQPGVAAAAMIVGPPLSGGQSIGHGLLIDGMELTNASSRFRPFVGDYFSAMGLDVRAGRGIGAADAGGELVAWVNEAFVARYLDGQQVLGSRVAWQPGEAGSATTPRWMRVVGVVSDVRSEALRTDESPAVYAPYVQREANWIGFGTLVAKVAGDPAGYREVLARAVTAGDPLIALGEVSSMVERAERALARDRFLLELVALFAMLALLLGVQGVFGVVAFAVEQRRAEIGVRLALGASHAQAIGVLMGATLPQILVGTLLGLGLTVAAARLAAGVLYGVSAFEPMALLLAGSALVVSALVAAWIPARSAQKVDLTTTLRQ